MFLTSSVSLKNVTGHGGLEDGAELDCPLTHTHTMGHQALKMFVCVLFFRGIVCLFF